MTERKPAGVSFETWADRQIREAEEQGSFAGLPGAGKPISGLEKPYDAMWWIKAKTEREGLSALPPTLALRKAAEGAREETSRAVPASGNIGTAVGAQNDHGRPAHRLETPPGCAERSPGRCRCRLRSASCRWSF
ncbi:DUF1992 domain-containing protein [Streptomyces sp. NPDC059446]|uniref:DnaJ family domain-containing protein n=1 Tax=Streptomyces sp. NPDC059446 TaxID=3346833 RepID=UPI003697A41F